MNTWEERAKRAVIDRDMPLFLKVMEQLWHFEHKNYQESFEQVQAWTGIDRKTFDELNRLLEEQLSW